MQLCNTQEEKSLLLFLETCAVDYGGAVVMSHMNDEDFKIAECWHREGFLKFGRICSKDIIEKQRRLTYWVRLSTVALALAHALRGERMERTWKNRKYRTAEEYRDGVRIP